MALDIEQIGFDWGALDDPTRAFVQEKTQAIHARLKRTAEDIIAIGQDLTEVKAKLPDMKFSAWLRDEFDMSRQSAYNFMRVFFKFGSCKTVLQLPAKILYELASPSTPETIIQMVETGQLPATIPAIREAKQELHKSYDLPWAQESLSSQQVEQRVDVFLTALEEDQRETASLKSAALTALQSSESNEWYTPAAYISAVRTLMGGIDLDPASCELANRVVQASRFYTKADNGLHQIWTGRVWLNPPYGFEGGVSNQEAWSRRLIEQYTVGNVSEAVLLVNANTEAKWFQPFYNHLICFTDHRIRFYSAEGESSQPTQGNALVYFGGQQARFVELFRRFGRVVREAQLDEY